MFYIYTNALQCHVHSECFFAHFLVWCVNNGTVLLDTLCIHHKIFSTLFFWYVKAHAMLIYTLYQLSELTRHNE